MVLPDVGLRFAGGSGGGQILVVTRSYSGSTDSFTNCIDGCAMRIAYACCIIAILEKES
jgi:hypothetical protein